MTIRMEIEGEDVEADGDEEDEENDLKKSKRGIFYRTACTFKSTDKEEKNNCFFVGYCSICTK